MAFLFPLPVMKRVLLPFVLAFIVSFSFVASANAGQPNMEAALSDLRADKVSLERAEANKGGHRTNALGLVNQAIAEVKAGMAAAR